MILHVRWVGGACEDILVEIPLAMPDRLRYPQPTIKKVRVLAKTLLDDQIAIALNKEGLVSAKGKLFNRSIVKSIRYKHNIPGPDLKRPEERTVKEVSKKFAVSPYVVYYWIERQIVAARRLNHGSPYWIKIDSQKEKELARWVRNSTRIHAPRPPNP